MRKSISLRLMESTDKCTENALNINGKAYVR